MTTIARGGEIALPPFEDNTLFPADATGKRFCEIFGRYRWNIIQADLPDDAQAKPDWQTITKYEMRPRVLWKNWQDANTLIGVRFTHTTTYALLDIDAGSDYCNPEQLAEIQAALETIGITRTLPVRSSWNEGLHLYIPLPEAVKTFDLAVALYQCLKSQGFRVVQGQLEIFPNIKAYGVETFIEYQAHRLPLQPGSGSCLLDEALNPLDFSLPRFFWRWDIAADHQAMDELRHALKIGRDNHRKKPKKRQNPVESWQQDLTAEITEGWTAHGQTNHLLKTIACYGRVFEGLDGQDLIAYTKRIAINAPGYEQWCRHQHEIDRKIAAWAKAVENYYWPFGTTPTRTTRQSEANLVSFNQQQADAAQERIRTTYTALEAAGELPETITARAKLLVERANVSLRTLYKNLALWHPAHSPVVIDEATGISAAENPPSEDGSATLDPLETEELSPVGGIMKGEGQSPCGEGSEKTSFCPDGGLGGDFLTFPQAGETPDPEVQEQIQRQVQRLGWSYEQISQFIVDHFEGKRWLWLNREEQLLLLYYLQTLVT